VTTPADDRSRLRPFWLAGAAAFLLDQLSKLVVVHGLGLATVGRIDVIAPFLVFRMAWNRGINFGLFASHDQFARFFLIALAVGISAWIFLWVRGGRHRPAQVAAAGLVVGGALANAVDRILYGAVADFINVSCCGIRNPYAFNLADVAIFLGAAALVLMPGPAQNDP